MICKKCGNLLPVGTTICPFCGQDINEELPESEIEKSTIPEPKKNKNIFWIVPVIIVLVVAIVIVIVIAVNSNSPKKMTNTQVAVQSNNSQSQKTNQTEANETDLNEIDSNEIVTNTIADEQGQNDNNITSTTTGENQGENTAPEIRLNNSETKLTNNSFIIRYEVIDAYDQNISVEIKNNRKSVGTANVSTDSVYWKTYKLTLDEGLNTIEIVAKNSKGAETTAKYEITVEYTLPEITINNEETSTEETSINLQYKLGDDYDTTLSVEIKNNGQSLYTGKVGTKSVTWKELAVELAEGVNKIEITATNSKGKTITKEYSIERIVDPKKKR